jgi:hypothetical protein
MSYGLQLIELNKTLSSLFDQAQVYILKKILGLPRTTSTKWVLWESNCLSAITLSQMIQLKAWRKYIILKTEHKSFQGNPSAFPSRPFFEKHVSQAMSSWGFSPKDILKWTFPEMHKARVRMPGAKTWNKIISSQAWVRETNLFMAWESGLTSKHPFSIIKPSANSQDCIQFPTSLLLTNKPNLHPLDSNPTPNANTINNSPGSHLHLEDRLSILISARADSLLTIPNISYPHKPMICATCMLTDHPHKLLTTDYFFNCSEPNLQKQRKALLSYLSLQSNPITSLVMKRGLSRPLFLGTLLANCHRDPELFHLTSNILYTMKNHNCYVLPPTG